LNQRSDLPRGVRSFDPSNMHALGVCSTLVVAYNHIKEPPSVVASGTQTAAKEAFLMTAEPIGKLTRKEKEFARAIAAGETMAAAYARAYSDRATRRAAEANARQVLKRGRVAAEVQRQRRYPSPDNYAAIQEYAIAKLIDMAESDSNPAVRHRAMTTLLEHAEKACGSSLHRKQSRPRLGAISDVRFGSQQPCLIRCSLAARFASSFRCQIAAIWA
jgi:hypothetical protein